MIEVHGNDYDFGTDSEMVFVSKDGHILLL